MNSNGGLKNIKSKKSASKISIIGDTPDMTKDIKKTIKYLEDIVINKETLQTLNTAKLVEEINKLIQYVEVLSIYKKPTFRLVSIYNFVAQQCASGSLSPSAYKKLELKKQILEELLQDSQLGDITFDIKESWKKFE